MQCNNSSLENLSAFVIAFASGALSVIAFIEYVAKVRRDERRTRQAP